MKSHVGIFSVLSFGALFLGGCLLFPGVGNAQVGISLYPVKFNVTVAQGESYADTITVINPNDFSIGVHPEVENIAGGDEGSIDLIDMEIPHGISSWVSIDRTEFTLGPQERRQIPFTVNVPANAEPGGHYGSILFRGISGPNGGVGISGRVGTVMLIEVPGATVKTGKIDSFTGPASYVSHGPFSFTAKLENTGNTHFNPESSISIKGPFYPEKSVAIEPRIVFPGHTRTFEAQVAGRYAFGPLTATLTSSMPGGAVTKTITFFAFPWQEALAVVAFGLLVWFGLGNLKKKFRIVRVKK
jgi:hypothetical protein